MITISHYQECRAFFLYAAQPSDCTCSYFERLRIAELEARVRELEAEAEIARQRVADLEAKDAKG